MSYMCNLVWVCLGFGISIEPFLSSGSILSSCIGNGVLGFGVSYALIAHDNRLLTGQSSVFGGPRKSNCTEHG